MTSLGTVALNQRHIDWPLTMFRPRVALLEFEGCYCFSDGKIVLHFTTDNLHQQNSRTGGKLAKMSCTRNTFLAQSRELLISRLGNFPWYSSNATRPATRFQPSASVSVSVTSIPRTESMAEFRHSPVWRARFSTPRSIFFVIYWFTLFALSLGTENVGGCHSRKSFIHATVHRYTDGQLVKPSGDWEPFRSDPGSLSLWGNVEIDPSSVTH